MLPHPSPEVNLALNYVTAIIVGIIALAGTAVLYLAAAQRQPAQPRQSQVYVVRDNPHPIRRKNPYLDAVLPPAPQHRMSIDLLRRRYQGASGGLRDPSSAVCSDAGSICRAGSGDGAAPQPHIPLDTMELDTDTVAVLDCAGVNRILSCVPPDELEKHRLVLDSFNWDIDVLLETEIMTSIAEE